MKRAGASYQVDTYASKRWGILLLLTLSALIAFVDRVNISSALAAKPFKDYFALSGIDRGWINSAFFWSYAVMQLPMGWVVDRYGVKWPYAASFLVWCLASAAIGLTSTLTGLILMRLIIGIAESTVVPATYRWIRDNFEPETSGAALGFYALGTKFGPALGAPAAAWLIVHLDWRSMFVITGLAGLVWLIPWIVWARDRVGPELADITETPAETPVSYRLSAILANRFVLATLVVYFCYNYFTFFCLTWMPAYLVEQRGLSLEEMGFYAFFSFAGIAIVAFVAGWLADEFIRKGQPAILVRKVFVVAGFAVASTVLLGAYAQSTEAAVFWNIVSLAGLGLATANNLALCSIMLIPSSIVGRIKGIQNTAVAIAGIVAPLMTGWLLDLTGSFVAPICLVFAFLVLGIVTVAFAIRPDWAPKAPNQGQL